MSFLVLWKGLVSLCAAFVALTNLLQRQKAAAESQLDTDSDTVAAKAKTDQTEEELLADADKIKDITSHS